jgi:hypothetical protein
MQMVQQTESRSLFGGSLHYHATEQEMALAVFKALRMTISRRLSGIAVLPFPNKPIKPELTETESVSENTPKADGLPPICGEETEGDEKADSVAGIKSENQITRRADMLASYRKATGVSNKRIYEGKSGVHKPQFYEWLNGKLPASSETAKNFERFLRENKPPIPRKPKH